MRRHLSSTTLWWLGLLLVAAYVALAASSAIFVLIACDLDCGDAGGRAAFALTVVLSPLAVAGFGMAARAATTERPRGAPRLLVRVILSAGWWTLAGGAGLLALLGLAASVEAVQELHASLTGRGLSGPLNYPDYARAQAREAAAFFSIIAALCVVLAVFAATVARRVRRAGRTSLSL